MKDDSENGERAADATYEDESAVSKRTVTIPLKEYDEIKSKKIYRYFIVDAALIFEANYKNFFDQTILITASKKIRLERAIKRTNISLENIQNRIASQMTDKEKINLADYVIDNNYTINNLHKKIDFVIDEIISIK